MSPVNPANPDSFTFIAQDECSRLDRFLAEVQGVCRRSQVRSRVGNLEVNQRPAKLSATVHPGDVITGTLAPPVSSEAVAQPVDIAVIHEDPLFLVVHKPQGLVVHPGAGNPDGTLVNGLLWRYTREGSSGELPQDLPGDAYRPGIVHRLDKDTSGVMIVARTVEVHAHLVDQFSRGEVEKVYVALVKGRPRENQGEIRRRIGRDPDHRRRFAVVEDRRHGKEAITEWQVLRTYGRVTLVRLRPRTGRTHQLRVHMASIGCPILGDPLYARSDRQYPQASLMLHALALRISPAPGMEVRTFRAPLAERFLEILSRDAR